MPFEWNKIAASHQDIAKLYIGELQEPDYHFLPGNDPYQFRWYVAPRVYAPRLPAVFLHIMMGDDPTGELHDHDWDNVTFGLGGRMIETYGSEGVKHGERDIIQGTIIHRNADETHSLRLDGCPYAMTLFTIGPKIRDNKSYKVG
jgi:hypothetical protein